MRQDYISLIHDILNSGSYTQAMLADRIGVSAAALSRWLNGHAKPYPRRVETIAKLHRQLIGFPALSKNELVGILKKASTFRQRSLWKIISGNEGLQKELLVEHTYNSTSIEGTTLSQKETEVVILEKGSIPGKSLHEHLEATNHAAVLRGVFQKRYREPLTESLIQSMHRSLLQGIREDAGSYSKHSRVIRGLDIELTHPKDIPEEMTHLLRAWNRSPSKTIRDIAAFHADFELIHPFGDGNGRIGRLLLALQCLEQGYPPVVIENVRKAEYYEVLEYAQKKSADPFTIFLVEEMERTARIIRRYI